MTRVEPVHRIAGHLAVPGDKSISHRAVLIGAISEGETRITGFGRSADTEATIDAVRALGVTVASSPARAAGTSSSPATSRSAHDR